MRPCRLRLLLLLVVVAALLSHATVNGGPIINAEHRHTVHTSTAWVGWGVSSSATTLQQWRRVLERDRVARVSIIIYRVKFITVDG